METTTPDWQTKELEAILKERLIGRHIVSVQADDGVEYTATEHPMRGSTMRLDDGHVLRLYCSEQDCCAYAGGEWIINPDNVDAMITDVRAVWDDENSGDDGDGTTNYVKIIVLHNQNVLAQADCSANDGNGGYYYSILSLDISHVIGKTPHDITVKVVDA